MAESSQAEISEEEREKLVAEVVRNVLFKTHGSAGCPIKREDLTHLVTRNYRQRSLPQFIINEARSKLSSIFGFEMKELQRIRSSKQRQSSQQTTGESKSYILVSNLPDDVYRNYVENKDQAHLTGLAFMAVAIVHLAGGKISSDDLWHHLRRLGLEEDDEANPLFGSTKQAVESLVLQRYLQKEKGEGPEGNTLIYELAERALDRGFLEKLQDYVRKMTGDEAADADVME